MGSYLRSLFSLCQYFFALKSDKLAWGELSVKKRHVKLLQLVKYLQISTYVPCLCIIEEIFRRGYNCELGFHIDCDARFKACAVDVLKFEKNSITQNFAFILFNS